MRKASRALGECPQEKPRAALSPQGHISPPPLPAWFGLILSRAGPWLQEPPVWEERAEGVWGALWNDGHSVNFIHGVHFPSCPPCKAGSQAPDRMGWGGGSYSLSLGFSLGHGLQTGIPRSGGTG